ncbi:MAG TPA: nucleoside diphosphate kinase regulator [Pseudolabrys sp.]|nr:nucleoside diphosphate kinase regulator [Pseudolabrys sp.]
MLIDIRHLDHPVSNALEDFTKRRISRALRPFQDAVSRVDVRTKDVNGPRGGIDIECSVSVVLAPIDQPVIVTSAAADPYVAIMDATARLHEAVSRSLGRRRRIARSGARGSRETPRPDAAGPAPAKAPPDSGGVAAKPSPDTGVGGQRSDLTVTAADQERLRRLIRASQDTRERDAAEALADELDRAEVVPAEDIAGNVVTMNSRIVFQDEATGERREISLVYPQDSDPDQGRISIFAPVGTALLGLSVGQTIDWPLPQGRLKRYRVVEIVYQPEAAGHLHL